jgi:hypothetical protein
MNVIFNFFNWLQSGPYLYNHGNFKNILVYSNIIFIIMALLVIKYKNNYSEHYIKYTFSLSLLIIMGFISAKFHHCQCKDSQDKFKKWCKIDVLSATTLGIIFFIVYFKNINRHIILLFIITTILFIYSPNRNSINGIDTYIVTHSLWHILSSLIFFLLIVRD